MARWLSAEHGLAATRIGFGFYFVVSAYGKTERGWLTGGAPMAHFVKSQAPHASGWYRHFLQGTVLPNAALFGKLVTLGEWGVGLSLLLGLLVPLGAVTGMWL